MRTSIRYLSLAAAFSCASPAAMAASDSDIQTLREEVKTMRQDYESRIAELEKKLEAKQSAVKTVSSTTAASIPIDTGGSSNANAFNPAIGVILSGRFSGFSNKNSDMKGFGIGEEGQRGTEGFALDESEINFSANADDKFFGSLTTAIVSEDGEDKIELEEAFLQTLPGIGLPRGLSIKAGRALWNVGYLNERHGHTDDFSDRPLPYRAYLNNGFNDDGVQLSYILPTDLYAEIGGGTFRGDDFPGGNASGRKPGTYLAYARVGGDIGDDQSWLFGTSWLHSDVKTRTTNDDTLTYMGKDNLYVANARYTWAPTGNPREKELTLQSEYFWRAEDGSYEDSAAGTGLVNYNGHDSGWYAQAVYKFLPQWRVGARYSTMIAPDVPTGLIGSALDANNHNPDNYAVMVDWTNSEFSRIRFQYNHETLSRGQDDNQYILQYTMSLGAHAAHKY